ncbi:MAG TPA: hypothetical protein VEQ38_23725, partial [Verrucomicrobiae bacterium]|nr:hypothetical protein [Verrucomicrobiae bacterium]
QKGPDMLRFRVPVDGTHTAQWYYSIHPFGEGERQTAEEMPLYHMPSPELDRHGQPQFQYLNNDVDPQDNAIFASQGAVVDRTKELLGESDHGVVLYRHLLDNQIKLIAAGKDPMNTFRDPVKNVRLDLATESREAFLTGRMGTQGMRRRYSQRFKPLADSGKPLP